MGYAPFWLIPYCYMQRKLFEGGLPSWSRSGHSTYKGTVPMFGWCALTVFLRGGKAVNMFLLMSNALYRALVNFATSTLPLFNTIDCRSL